MRRTLEVYTAYAGSDHDWADWVAAQLCSAGITVELDTMDWANGDDFVDWLDSALRRATTLVPLWSRAFFAPGSYAAYELAQAHSLGLEIVPFRVEPVMPPPRWRGLASADLFDTSEDEAVGRLLDRVAGSFHAEVAPFPADPPRPGVVDEWDVFLSYGRKDRPYAERLEASLIERGVKVWWDVRLRPGAGFSHAIAGAIDRCRAFVPVLSPAYVEGKWTRRELSRAARLGKPILPLLLERGDVPIEVEGLQYEKVLGGQLPSDAFVELLQATRLEG
jgi:hypothetical protein